jgi:hypothetical protein
MHFYLNELEEPWEDLDEQTAVVHCAMREMQIDASSDAPLAAEEENFQWQLDIALLESKRAKNTDGGAQLAAEE